MTKQKEKILQEYKNEYTLTSYYHKILYLNKTEFTLSKEQNEYAFNNYLKHSYALNLVSRLLSASDHKNLLPAIRESAVNDQQNLYNSFLLRVKKEV